MIYSNACEYAIRGLAYLAEHNKQGRTLVRVIAEEESIPAPFLGKIFQTLVKQGLLSSAKGPGGGFTLARPAADISLLEIRAAVDGTSDLEECAVGLEVCSDDTPCPLHDLWKPIRQRIVQYLSGTSLQQLADSLSSKRQAG